MRFEKFIRKTTIIGFVVSLPLFWGIQQKSSEGFNEKTDQHLSALIGKVKTELLQLKKDAAGKKTLPYLQQHFYTARLAYKRMAVLTDYFNPYQYKQLNSPAIPRIESEIADRIIPPQGFQALEQLLFADWNKNSGYLELNRLADEMLVSLETISNEPDRHFKFSKAFVFDALRSAIISVTTLGITGFDSPVINYSLPEAIASLQEIKELISFYRPGSDKNSQAQLQKVIALTDKAITYLKTNNRFATFDRLGFITGYINPLYKQLIRYRMASGTGIPEGRSAVNYDAESFFALDFFNINFYSPPSEYWVTPERVSLGKKIFSDPILSGTGTRSCASCHKPELAFTDGLAKPYSLDNSHLLPRNTPTIINAGFQTRQFLDSRSDILENQLSEVVHNTDEMEGTMQRAVELLSDDPAYISFFNEAYPAEKQKITPFTIANAISSYVRSLVSLNAPFDRYVRGDQKSLSASAKNGFNLFAGKAKCATCHFIPLFNGVVPPSFAETESEIIGVPKTKDKKPAILDDDPGKYNFTKSEIHRYSFKTPTLRNVALTAPYMHNGVYTTLDEVMEFYNNGGGKGLHIAPVYQTLPFDKLNLTKTEVKDIIAFMKSLTDTSFNKTRL